jgi:hypothetical protein
MRLTFLTVCMILLYNGFPGAARAQGNPCQDYPWCMETLERRTDCSFTTYEVDRVRHRWLLSKSPHIVVR